MATKTGACRARFVAREALVSISLFIFFGPRTFSIITPDLKIDHLIRNRRRGNSQTCLKCLT